MLTERVSKIALIANHDKRLQILEGVPLNPYGISVGRVQIQNL